MARPRRDRALALFCVVASCAAAGTAAADKPRNGNGSAVAAPSASAMTDAEAEAQKHFARARDLYKQGSYREAIVELEAAVKLDPKGKELVYNLGVLHEKLGDIDDALKYFRQYALMDLTPEERDKTEAAIRRLEGAKKEVEDRKKAPPPPPPPPPPVQNGRVDELTIGAASLAGLGLVGGVFFAITASSQRPPSNFVTGKDGTYADLQSRADISHKDAIVADVGFGVAIAAGVGAVLLWALRPKETKPRPTTGQTSVSAAPMRGGGALLFERRF